MFPFFRSTNTSEWALARIFQKCERQWGSNVRQCEKYPGRHIDGQHKADEQERGDALEIATALLPAEGRKVGVSGFRSSGRSSGLWVFRACQSNWPKSNWLKSNWLNSNWPKSAISLTRKSLHWLLSNWPARVEHPPFVSRGVAPQHPGQAAVSVVLLVRHSTSNPRSHFGSSHFAQGTCCSHQECFVFSRCNRRPRGAVHEGISPESATCFPGTTARRPSFSEGGIRGEGQNTFGGTRCREGGVGERVGSQSIPFGATPLCGQSRVSNVRPHCG